jgi:hypothetical protein
MKDGDETATDRRLDFDCAAMPTGNLIRSWLKSGAEPNMLCTFKKKNTIYWDARRRDYTAKKWAQSEKITLSAKIILVFFCEKVTFP